LRFFLRPEAPAASSASGSTPADFFFFFLREPAPAASSASGSTPPLARLGLLFFLEASAPSISESMSLVEKYRNHEFYRAALKVQPYVPEALRDDYQSLVDLLNKPPEPIADMGEMIRDVTKGEESTSSSGPDGAATQKQEPAEGQQSGATGDTATDAGGGGSDALDDARIRRIIREELAAMNAPASDSASAIPDDGPGGFLQLARSGVQRVFSFLGAVVGLGLIAFLIPFYFFFFAIWYPNVQAFGRQFIPRRNRDRVLYLLEKMDNVVAGFVRGRIVISLIMGVLLAIGWMICGVPYAIPLGIVVGIFCAVPYLGVVGIPAAVLLLFFDQLGVAPEQRLAWWWIVIWPTVVFSIVQLIEGYLLTPVIAGKVTNLDPVTILVAVLAGGSVLGVYGMLLAIPLAACGKIMFTEVLMPKMKEWVEGRREDPLPIERE